MTGASIHPGWWVQGGGVPGAFVRLGLWAQGGGWGLPGSHGDVQCHVWVQIAVGVCGHGYQVGLGTVEGGEMSRWSASGMNGCKLMMQYLEFKNSGHFQL